MTNRLKGAVCATAIGLWSVACAPSTPRPAERELRVCADPNNLPFSNSRQEGFENKLADLIAKDLDAKVSYTWWAQRRGFIRNTLNAGKCDVVMGVPSGFELALTTNSYYRSTYVFVTRKDRNLDVRSFDDPRLRTLRVGVHLVGDDGANTPPVHALSSRGVVGNVRGYMLAGDYTKPNPPARLIEAVAKGDVDIAIAWGPLAGYFAKTPEPALILVPVSPAIDVPFLPEVYDISLAVRRSDKKLKAELDSVLDREHAAIAAILDQYGVPRVARVPGLARS
ncbi:MAG TPA: substrate-binding domain-containing protein [Gemmatimonadaceae bacterium]|jgi:mxaJ protein|nr:substrate-binding domain-containing protein [Gemmatimonadaceae bacterium]